MAEKTITCGACGEVFKSKKEYSNHVCKVTGKKANTIEHLDAQTNGRYSMQAKAALKRGEAKKKK